jgi:hypothetical protein
MLEQSLQKLFQRQADSELPPGKITAAEVLRQGRIRRRRRRMSTIGTPVFAAVAVGAIALAGTLPSGMLGHSRPQTGSYGTFVGGAFDPSYLDFTLGWLPSGYAINGGETSPADESVFARNTKQRTAWGITAFARDVCHVTTDGQQLQCSQPGPPQPPIAVIRSGPVIDGHRSLWLKGGLLAFEYAANCWAVISDPGYTRSDRAAAVRIAGAAKFGQHVPLSYASRFTSLPPGWRILATEFSSGPDSIGSSPAGVYLAWSYDIVRLRTISPATQVELFNTAIPDVPNIAVSPPLKAPPTRRTPPRSGRQHTRYEYVTIHGYRFMVSDQEVTQHRHMLRLTCGDADGLVVSVVETGTDGDPDWALSPAQVLERMQLLGPNPADWVANPLP